MSPLTRALGGVVGVVAGAMWLASHAASLLLPLGGLLVLSVAFDVWRR